MTSGRFNSVPVSPPELFDDSGDTVCRSKMLPAQGAFRWWPLQAKLADHSSVG
jgi:hypothetical protein